MSAMRVPIRSRPCRVSSRGMSSTTIRQLIAMRDFGVAEENIIIEKQSGKDFQRELYLGLVQRLRPGDVLVVKSIDRLGRNYTEILEQWGAITKGREAAIVVLDMPLLDTRQGREHRVTSPYRAASFTRRRKVW